jgi:hypothetical protein
MRKQPGKPFQNPFTRSVSAAQVEKRHAAEAIASVQSTLFAALRSSYPDTRGDVAWCLCHATLAGHSKNAPSLAALASLSPEERAGLRATVMGLLERPKAASSAPWASLVRQIVTVLT